MLLIVTVGVLATVITQLVRWINHLGSYGLMDDTLRRIEKAATDALDKRLSDPFLCGRPLTPEFEAQAQTGQPIMAAQVGYVQMIDMPALNAAAAEAGITLAVTALPGVFVHKGQEVAMVLSPGNATDEVCDRVCSAFAIGSARTYEQDPRFGIETLTEIASRALSPSVNDPGTAIDVLGRHLRIIARWRSPVAPELAHRSVMVRMLDLDDLMSDAFDPIARDGAALVEVQVRLQKMLIGLVRTAPEFFGPPALRVSRRAQDHAHAALVLAQDKARIDALADDLSALVATAPDEGVARTCPM